MKERREKGDRRIRREERQRKRPLRSAAPPSRTAVRHAPKSPGVYPDAELRRTTCSMSARPRTSEAFVLLCARPTGLTTRGSRAGWSAATGDRRDRLDPDRDRSAAARSQPDRSRLRCALTCCCATTSRFPILITGDHWAPQIRKTIVGRSRGRDDYYGPFASVGAVNRTITALQRAFLNCAPAAIHSSRSRSRPCLLYQIKRCSGPLHQRDRFSRL